MKKNLIQVLLLAAVPVFFTACDVISPVNLDSFVFENSVDPQSSFYCGEESTDTDGDGIGDYLDADEIILLEPEDGAEVTSGSITLSFKAKSSTIAKSYGFIVSDNSDLSDPIIEVTDLESPSFLIEISTLSANHTYYWAGIVTNAKAELCTSDIRSFEYYTVRSVTLTLSGGYYFSLVVTDSGSVKSCGTNHYGELGDGTTVDSSEFNEISDFTDVIEVSGGEGHAIALKSTGDVWTWGYNGQGQLGLGNEEDVLIPASVSTLSDISSISAGYEYSLALDDDGTVWSFGSNTHGELGNNTTDDSSLPVKVLLSDGETPLSDIIEISAGGYSAYALKNDGTVWAWGYNGYGQLGEDPDEISVRSTAEQVSGLSSIVEISCNAWGIYGYNRYAVYALKDDGSLMAWGGNGYGQLGNESTDDSYTPVSVPGLNDIISISAGEGFCLALSESGDIWSWGLNLYGALGNGTNENSLIPIKISSLSNVVSIGTGNLHSLALDLDGKLWMWGSNLSGEIGDGTTTNQSSPVEITGF